METDSFVHSGPGRKLPDVRRFILTLILGFLLGWLGSAGCALSRTGKDTRLIAQAWSLIDEHYVDRGAIKPKAMTYDAIRAMVNSLGDTGHTTFLTPEMVKQLNNMERGEFKGIGVEIHIKNGRVVILAPIQGSPAQRAGLRSGDIIQKVASQNITGWPLSRVAEHISGPAGTPVTLTVNDPHTGKTFTVTVVRASIRIRDVTWEWVPGTKIAHLRLAGFGGGVTEELREALGAINSGGAKGIILDLRDNPGGILEQAVGVGSQFLKGGNVVLMKNAQGQIKPAPVEKGGIATNIPLVVLINEGSASAAEIVAGALKDAHRAPLVGETTFGTGTVLGQFNLSDGSELLLAIEEWLTPAGHSFWHKGILPNVKVALPDEALPLFPSQETGMTPRQFKASNDTQLHRALEILRGQGGRESAGNEEAVRSETVHGR